MGRWAYRLGISAMEERAPKRIALQIWKVGGEWDESEGARGERTYKNKTPPREKKAEVETGVLKKTVPMIIPWKMYELKVETAVNIQ